MEHGVALQIYTPERKFFTCMKKKSKRKQVFFYNIFMEIPMDLRGQAKARKRMYVDVCFFPQGVLFCFVLREGIFFMWHFFP